MLNLVYLATLNDECMEQQIVLYIANNLIQNDKEKKNKKKIIKNKNPNPMKRF